MAKKEVTAVTPIVHYPQRIRFTSDDTELELVGSKVVNGVVMVNYRYVKSITKLGEVLSILDIHLKGALESTFCKMINR